VSEAGLISHAVLDCLPECVTLLARDGTVLHMNPAGLRMYEAESPDQLIGRCLYHRVRDDHVEAFRSLNQSVFAEGTGGRLEFAVRGRNGTERIFETNMVALPGAAGEVIGALSVTRDVTSRRQAELRDALLVHLDDEMRSLSEPQEITGKAVQLLCEHLGADRCSYAEIDTGQGFVNVIGNYSKNLPGIIGWYPIASFGNDFLDTMRAGRPYVFRDAGRDLSSKAFPAYQAMGIAAIAAIPLIKRGQLVAGMGVHQATPRQWRDDEIDLIRTVANRCWESIVRGRAERRLRASEEQFRTLADAIPNLAWMAHGDGYVFWYNRRWYEYTGAKPQDMEGWGWQSVHDPAILPSVLERWKRSLATAEPFEMVFPLRSAGGPFRSFLTRVEPLKDEAGRVLRWFGTNTDVTAQREAELREKRAKEVAELLNRVGPLLAAELDPLKLTQTITDIATEAVQAEFGTFFQESGEVSPAGRITRSDDLTSDPRYENHSRLTGPDGRPVRSYLAVPVTSRTGAVAGSLVFGHSSVGVFTAEAESIVLGIAAQAAIALDNAAMFEETRRAGAALQRSNAELIRLNEDLNQFAYSASHDLREPLRMVSIFTQLLERKLTGQLDRKGQEYLERILKGAFRMEALVRDLLAYTQTAKDNESDVARADANDALRAAMANLSTVVAEAGARVRASRLPSVKIPEVQLTQVLQNLIENAVKYRRGGGVEIGIDAVGRDGAWEFAVSDNGIGIAPEYREQIFGIFKRLHTNDEYPGTGIGLAICQRIIQKAGGRIWVESEPGCGSTFFFTLPAARKD
jgi:PAS domain S-box-containing protein